MWTIDFHSLKIHHIFLIYVHGTKLLLVFFDVFEKFYHLFWRSEFFFLDLKSH